FASSTAFAKQYPYKPHYSMLIHQERCIDCERCMEACAKTNRVPGYGYRTNVLERQVAGATEQKREFIPVLCNQCNKPPCVLGCPAKARIFGDLSDPGSEVYHMIHQVQKTVWVLRPEAGAQPNVFYTRG